MSPNWLPRGSLVCWFCIRADLLPCANSFGNLPGTGNGGHSLLNVGGIPMCVSGCLGWGAIFPWGLEGMNAGLDLKSCFGGLLHIWLLFQHYNCGGGSLYCCGGFLERFWPLLIASLVSSCFINAYAVFNFIHSMTFQFLLQNFNFPLGIPEDVSYVGRGFLGTKHCCFQFQ